MAEDKRKLMPVCGKCGQAHYGFVACANVDEWRKTHETAENRRRPTIVRQPRPDGLKDWGDQLDTVVRIGGNTFGSLRTVPLQTGTVIYPEPPEAA